MKQVHRIVVLSAPFIGLVSGGRIGRFNIRGGKRVLNSIDDGAPTPSNVEEMSFQFDDPSATTDGQEPLSLEGTSWTAVDIANVEPIEPITLGFLSDGDGIYGDAGCNRYRGTVDLLTDTLTVGFGDNFSTTKKFCGKAGVMEAEKGYLNLLRGETFFYEVTSTETDELVLFEYISNPEGESTKGDVLARFSTLIRQAE